MTDYKGRSEERIRKDVDIPRRDTAKLDKTANISCKVIEEIIKFALCTIKY